MSIYCLKFFSSTHKNLASAAAKYTSDQSNKSSQSGGRKGKRLGGVIIARNQGTLKSHVGNLMANLLRIIKEDTTEIDLVSTLTRPMLLTLKPNLKKVLVQAIMNRKPRHTKKFRFLHG